MNVCVHIDIQATVKIHLLIYNDDFSLFNPNFFTIIRILIERMSKSHTHIYNSNIMMMVMFTSIDYNKGGTKNTHF